MVSGVASSWVEALELTPNQTVAALSAVASTRTGTPSGGPRRRGTKDEFKAAVLGAMR